MDLTHCVETRDRRRTETHCIRVRQPLMKRRHRASNAACGSGVKPIKRDLSGLDNAPPTNWVTHCIPLRFDMRRLARPSTN